MAPEQCIDLAAAEGGYDTIHAYPSIDNAASNALCRRLGFELLGQERFEYPKGHWMTCNDWSLDLRARARSTARYEIDWHAGRPRTRSGASCIRCTSTWLNDPEVAWNVFGAAVQRSFEDERAWIEQYLADPMTRLWLIYRLDEARPIG